MGKRYSEFSRWNKLKKTLSFRRNSPHCKPGEVWWCVIGRNIGNEQGSDNKNFSRPVLVLSVFSKNIFLGLPLTSKFHPNSRNHYNLLGIPRLRGSVILTQSRTLDSRRLLRLITRIDEKIFYEIKNSFKRRI